MVPGNPGFAGHSSGEATYVAVNRLAEASELICPVDPIPNTRFLGHEFGHYMGLNHTFADDSLWDTAPDPSADTCTATLMPWGTDVRTGQIIETNNIMSYYNNIDYIITPMQAALTRAAAYFRLYN
jgi:hypothetical protein